MSITADSGTLRTSSLGAGARRARYLAGSAFSLGGQALQQTNTFRPLTATGIGAPIEPSLAPVTGQTFCPSTVGVPSSLAPSRPILARYLSGFALIAGQHAAQQVQTFCSLTSTATASPIEPSPAPVTGQIFCSSAVRIARRTPPLPRMLGLAATTFRNSGRLGDRCLKRHRGEHAGAKPVLRIVHVVADIDRPGRRVEVREDELDFPFEDLAGKRSQPSLPPFDQRRSTAMSSS